MFRSFGPRLIESTPGQVLVFASNQLIIATAADLFAIDFAARPLLGLSQSEVSLGLLPVGFRAPRHLRLALECGALTAGTFDVVLHGYAGGANSYELERKAFGAVGADWLEWDILTPHWRLAVEKAGGGLAKLTCRVVAVFD